MILNIPVEDFLLIVLNGDMCRSVAVPLGVGELIKSIPDYENVLHLDTYKGAQFYELYSKFGWENELKRREYVASLGVPNPALPPRVKVESNVEQLAILKKRLTEAILEENMTKIMEIKRQMKAIQT